MKSKSIAIVITVIAVFSLLVIFQSQITGFVSRTGTFDVGNSAPTIDQIFLNEQLTSDTAGDVTINPVEESTKSVNVKIKITDSNGNCNTFIYGNATAYICEGDVACNAGSFDHQVNLTFNDTDGAWGSGNIYCNMSGESSPSLQFYDSNGTWTVNVTLTDGTDTAADKNLWTYGELPAFTYATGGTVSFGALTVGQENAGLGDNNQVKNTGNIILDLNWSATNFTGSTNGVNVSVFGSNFMIDDDTSASGDAGNIPEASIDYIGDTTFSPASGLLTCTSTGCSNENATFNIYYHLIVPAGLGEDTYTNTIDVTSEYH